MCISIVLPADYQRFHETAIFTILKFLEFKAKYHGHCQSIQLSIYKS